jgi:protoporphyrinogen oxidase
MKPQQPVVVIGAGFTGLAAAYELSLAGLPVVVLEADAQVGGLASSFATPGASLEKFYHHWFTSDQDILTLADELGVRDQISFRATRTGVYAAHRFFRLSSPLDVLRFKPLSILDRVRLGTLALRAQRVKDFAPLESKTAREWLIELGGLEVYRVVWEPLLRGKFGTAADSISAVWIANKLKLRGGSRGKRGEERLAYFAGGFSSFADALHTRIQQQGGEVRTSSRVSRLDVSGRTVVAVQTATGPVEASAVLATPALPIVADLLGPHVSSAQISALNAIDYLGNVCLVLELDRSLSTTYWLNVNDPGFPFVAVIEHTNFESEASYDGRRVVYLSRYLERTDPYFSLSDSEILDHSLIHLQRMFPAFQRDWLKSYHVWRADYAQPIVRTNYASRIPPVRGPLERFYLSTMAQIYPEDRGTNYAVRNGRAAARTIIEDLHGDRSS